MHSCERNHCKLIICHESGGWLGSVAQLVVLLFHVVSAGVAHAAAVSWELSGREVSKKASWSTCLITGRLSRAPLRRAAALPQ